MIPRPDPSEYAPFYAGYVARVPAGDLLNTLRAQSGELQALARGLDDEQARHRYAAGKWSIKEVLGHLADAERIFAYRALRFARGDETPLAGFEENAYVAAAGFDARPVAGLADELAHLRSTTLDLFSSLDDRALARRGTANGTPVTVRALAWIVAGHERHHLGILRDRYLSA